MSNPPGPRPQLRTQLTFLDRLLVGTVLFQGMTGLLGGLMLIATPGRDGELLPGAILAGGLGVTALIIAWGLSRTPASDRLAPIERVTGHHGPWVAAIGLGTGLMAWIVVELVLLPEWSWLQPFYLAVGAVIVATAATPAVHGRLRRPGRQP